MLRWANTMPPKGGGRAKESHRAREWEGARRGRKEDRERESKRVPKKMGGREPGQVQRHERCSCATETGLNTPETTSLPDGGTRRGPVERGEQRRGRRGGRGCRVPTQAPNRE